MGSLSELRRRGRLEKTILTRRYLVLLLGEQLIGIEGDCKHMRASLASGAVTDGVITCPWHGWRYQLASGECLSMSGTHLKRYRTWIEGELVMLDPAAR